MRVRSRVPPSADWKRGPRFYRFFYRWLYPFGLPLMNVRARGQERAPADGPLILAMNHLSYLDPVLVGVALPRPVHWLAKKEVFNGPVWSWFFTQFGALSVDREAGQNRDVLDAAIRLLGEGRAVGVFPEATRQPHARAVGPTRSGVARLAYLTGAPVLPVGIASDAYYGRGKTIPRFGRRVYLNMGEPLHFPQDPALAEDAPTARKTTDVIMHEVRRLVDEAATARERRERWPRARKFPTL